ncbi:hypothetical protein BJY52DRAFT_1232686, partial [Lactarius psammicola]
INDALRAPVLTELRDLLVGPDWVDEEGAVERIHKELMVELGRDVSESQTGFAAYYLTSPLQIHKDNDFPATVEGFNLSVGLVINALDTGVEDHRGDLEQAGLVPSSWFQLASAVLGAISRVAAGLTRPVTQGGRLAAQAQQIANFFIHYASTDEPPL